MVENVNGLEIRNTDIAQTNEYGIRVENSNDMFLSNIDIKHSMIGIMSEGVKGFEISSSSLHFTSNFSILLRNTENGIINNITIGNSENGIKLESLKMTQIKNSTIENSNRGGIFENSFNLSLIALNLNNLELHGIQILSSENIYTENLKCSDVKKWECVLLRNTENAMIFNNSFMNSMVGIEIGNSSNIKVKDNMFFNISEYCIKIPDYNPEKIYLENNFLDPKCKLKV
jgi:parallel beta-helix repeat protein